MVGRQYGICSPRVENNKTFIFRVFYINFGNCLGRVSFEILFQISSYLFFLDQTRWILFRFVLSPTDMADSLVMCKYGFVKIVENPSMKVEISKIQKLSKQVRGPPR